MGQASSSSPFPCRTMAASPSVQFTTVEGSIPPIPPSITRSTTSPSFSSISSGSVTVFVLVIRQRGGHDRSIQQTGNFTDDTVIRHTDTYFFPVSKDFGQPVSSVQDKSERSGQVAFHQLENVVVHFGIFTDAAQVIANNREIVFLRVNLFDPADAFDGTFLQAMATDGILGVCGIDNQSPVVQ